MPLPIAIGGISISQQTLEQSDLQPDFADDGETLLEPRVLYETIGWDVCASNEWYVSVVCTYYDMWPSGKINATRNCTMVQVRIQVSSLASPLTKDCRATTHRLRLFEEDGAESSVIILKKDPQVHISSDRRNVAVLLSHPHRQSTALVIFQLRTPRIDVGSSVVSNPGIPIPSYIINTESDDSRVGAAPRVATNPRFVPIWGITAIACLPRAVNPSIFIIVRNDGSMLWLDARSCVAVATGWMGLRQEQLDEWMPISTLRLSPASQVNRGSGVFITQNAAAIVIKWDLRSHLLRKTKLPSVLRVATGSVIGNLQSLHRMLPTGEDPKPPTPHSGSLDFPDKADSPMGKLARNKSSDLTEVLSPSVHKALRLPSTNTSPKGLDLAPMMLDQQNLSRIQKQVLNTIAGTDCHSETHMRSREKEARLQVNRQQLPHYNPDDKSVNKSQTADVHEKPNRQMEIQILSILNDEADVQDVLYTRFPTLVCVLFGSAFANPKVAAIYDYGPKDDVRTVVELEKLPDTKSKGSITTSAKRYQTQGEGEILPVTQNCFGLHYDQSSDSFAISTPYPNTQEIWFGCIWNWRDNTLGWTIENQIKTMGSYWSRLYFSECRNKGNQLVVLQSMYTESKQFHAHRQSARTAILSPRSHIYNFSLQPTSLLLGSDFVQFPIISQHMRHESSNLTWNTIELPEIYREMYGSPKLAAIGQGGLGPLAIASTRGLCILDQHSKWRQFGTPSEEKSLQIVAMVWWEGAKADEDPAKLTEDFLIAVIQSDNGRQYLSCWSPKHLDSRHQLLCNGQLSLSGGGFRRSSWGVPLPKDREVAFLSFLSEPFSNKRRGVLLLSSKMLDGSGLDFSIYRLQASEANTMETTFGNDSQIPAVLAQEFAQGLVDRSDVHQPVASMFLASASFDFNLEKYCKQRVPTTGMLAVFGVVRSCPGSLDAVALIDGDKYTARVLNGEIRDILLSDRTFRKGSESGSAQHSSLSCSFWKIGVCSGEVYCWKVPQGDADLLLDFLLHAEGPKIRSQSELVLVGRGREPFGALGSLCTLGDGTNFMYQSDSGTQHNMMLGQAPDAGLGCNLRSGQLSQLIKGVRSLKEGKQGSGGIKIHAPSPFQIVAPVFIPTFYMSLLETSIALIKLHSLQEHESQQYFDKEGKTFQRINNIGKHTIFRLQQCDNQDIPLMTLQILLFRSIDNLSLADKKHSRFQSNSSKLELDRAKIFFAGVIDIARDFSTNLQFATLLLAVARQIEPNQLAYLFPLSPAYAVFPFDPQTSEAFVSRHNARSAKDLFDIARTSLPTSLSALTLLDLQSISHDYVGPLFKIALSRFLDNIGAFSNEFDQTKEERRVLSDLFLFGIKVEDANLSSKEAGLHENEGFFRRSSNDFFSTDDEVESPDGLADTSTKRLFCTDATGRTFLASMLSIFARESKEEREEDIIHRAATSFIANRTKQSHMENWSYLNRRYDESFSISEGRSESTFASSHQSSWSDEEIPVAEDIVTMASEAMLQIVQQCQDGRHWKSVLVLARALVPHSRQCPGLSMISQALQVTETYEMEKFIKKYLRHHGNADHKSHSEPIKAFLELETRLMYSQFQLPTQDAVYIADVISLLLERLDKDKASPFAGLALAGVVASYCSGKTTELREQLGDDHHMVLLLESLPPIPPAS